MPVKIHQYSNKDITIIWKPDVCIHSKLCWHNLRTVFDPAKRPWIEPEAADSATIMAQIDKCPSGALSYIKNDAQETTMATKETATAGSIASNAFNTIECLHNGPLMIKGDIVIKKSDGTEEIKTGIVTLCRCGASKNKPYCDGSHRAAGFEG